MAEQAIQYFKSAEEALASGRPFRLLKIGSQYPLDIGNIDQDKWHLFHDTFLSDTSIQWPLNNKTCLQFITPILRNHRSLQSLQLTFEYESCDADQEDLAKALQSSPIRELTVIKQYSYGRHINLSTVLRALQSITTLQRLIVWYAPTLPECEALASALQNHHLQAFVPQHASYWSILAPSLMNRTLRDLELNFNHEDCEHIAKVLSTNKSLETLTMTLAEDVTAADTEKFVVSSLKDVKLKSLTLVPANDEQLSQFFKALANDQLTVGTMGLKFMYYPDPRQISESNVAILGESLKTNKTLTSITFTPTVMDKYKALGEGLKHNSTLLSRTTTFSSDSEGLTALCDALKTNTSSLTELDLRDSTFTSEHFELIADMLQHNTSLKTFILGDVAFDDKSLTSVARAMQKNRTLRKLGIECSSTKYGIIGVQSLSDMIRSNTTLQQLELSCDKEDYLDLICDALKHNTSVHFLRLYDIYELQTLSDKLVQLLEHNQALTTIKPLPAPLSKVVQPLLQRNQQLKSEAQFKVAILSHNIARSDQALTTLPRELWIKILSHVTHPGTDFEMLVNTIFGRYTNNY